MEVISLLTLAVLVWKIVDFVKFIRAADWNATITQAVVWVAGVILVILFSESDFGSLQVIGDIPLSDMNYASLALIGLQLGSTASGLVDFKKANDAGDSAKTPELLTGTKSAC